MSHPTLHMCENKGLYLRSTTYSLINILSYYIKNNAKLIVLCFFYGITYFAKTKKRINRKKIYIYVDCLKKIYDTDLDY